MSGKKFEVTEGVLLGNRKLYPRRVYGVRSSDEAYFNEVFKVSGMMDLMKPVPASDDRPFKVLKPGEYSASRLNQALARRERHGHVVETVIVEPEIVEPEKLGDPEE